MIVCRECGTQNDDDDLFCGGCPAFLEHSGERIADDEPVIVEEPAVEPPEEGLVTRIKHAITGDSLPPPVVTADDAADAPAAPTGSPAELDDDQRRAASLVAKPVEEDRVETPGATTSAVGARSPQAQQPKKAAPRPKPAKQPPSRKILPGDLICGRCGEGNPDTRQFCRRCGESLIEAEVMKEPWYKRILPKRKKKTLKASERPDRGRDGQVGTKARLFRGKVLGRAADARRLIAILAIVGIGVGFAIPSTRSAIMDGGGGLWGRVRRTVSPTYSNIPIDPDRVTASSRIPGAPPEAVADSNTLTYWEGGGSPASVTVTFVEPTDVEHVLVHPGKQEDGGKVVRPDPRPRALLIRVTDVDGVVHETSVTLEDEDGFQTVGLGVDQAVSAETVVVDCFPDPIVKVCPITELEFQSKD